MYKLIFNSLLDFYKESFKLSDIRSSRGGLYLVQGRLPGLEFRNTNSLICYVQVHFSYSLMTSVIRAYRSKFISWRFRILALSIFTMIQVFQVSLLKNEIYLSERMMHINSYHGFVAQWI